MAKRGRPKKNPQDLIRSVHLHVGKQMAEVDDRAAQQSTITGKNSRSNAVRTMIDRYAEAMKQERKTLHHLFSYWEINFILDALDNKTLRKITPASCKTILLEAMNEPDTVGKFELNVDSMRDRLDAMPYLGMACIIDSVERWRTAHPNDPYMVAGNIFD